MSKNGFRIIGNTTEVVVYKKGTKQPIATILIDSEDQDKVSRYSWCITALGYAVANVNHQHTFLHHYIKSRHETKMTDHINRNKLDNRKSNLRYVGGSINALNRDLRVDNTSGVQGVSWNKQKKCWTVYLWKNKIRIACKLVKTLKKATALRKDLEIKHYGFSLIT